MRLLMLLGWVWACLGTEDSVVIIKKLGEDVVLKPSEVSEAITSILWTYGPNFAVQWDGTNIKYYRHFKERGDLNLLNGWLTIRNLQLNDTNYYAPEINGKLQSKIDLKVHGPVPKPEITVNGLNLVCNGDTKDAEPVTYSWSLDNMMLPYSSKEIHTTENSCSEFFTCTMQNPVSEMKSDRFQPCPSNVRTVVIVVVVVIILLIVGGAIGHRIKTKEWFYQKDPRCWKADFWKNTTQCDKHNEERAAENARMAGN